MKVLYITSNCESVQIHLLSALRSMGIDAQIFRHTTKRPVVRDGLEHEIVYHYPIFSKGPFLYLTKLYITARKCEIYCRDNNIDILHGNMAVSDGIICRKVHVKTKKPYVLSVRNTDLYLSFLWKLPWIKKEIYRNIKEATALVFLSPKYLEELLARIPTQYAWEVRKKSRIIPNGIDDYFLDNITESKKLPGDTLHLIVVGKINALKNLETTVESIDILKRKHIKADLTVVGEIEDDNYKNLIFKRDDIFYHEKCSKEQVLTYLRQADIFVMPSHRETFGLVYAEAMTQGLPVIYTRGQGFDGQFEDGLIGYSVNDNNPEEIVEKIIEILEDYVSISKRCRNSVQRFRWNLVAEQIINECYSNSNSSCNTINDYDNT